MNTKELVFALAKRIREQLELSQPIRDIEDALDIIADHVDAAIKKEKE